jgi:hypothetical protein
MATPGFTAESSLHGSRAEYAAMKSMVRPRAPLEPAQFDEVFEKSIDELGRSTTRLNPPICLPLFRGLAKGCYDIASIECITECAGQGKQFHQLCLNNCLSRRTRYCDMMNQICLPIRTSPRDR